MKVKKIALIIAVSAMLLGCAGCASGVSESKKSDMLEADGVQNIISVEQKKELKISKVLDENTVYALKDSLANKKKASVPKEITVEGKSYKISYSDSVEYCELNFDISYYTFDMDGTECEVGFCDTTGELVRFQRMFVPWDNDLPVLPEEELIKIATDAFCQIAPEIDVESYTIEVESCPYMGGNIYEIWFVRYVNGVSTSDRVKIAVRDYGYIDAMQIRQLGMFKDFKMPTVVKSGAAKEAAINSKKAVNGIEKAEVKISELTILSDGRYAMHYYVSSSDGSPYSSLECIYVVLE